MFNRYGKYTQGYAYDTFYNAILIIQRGILISESLLLSTGSRRRAEEWNIGCEGHSGGGGGQLLTIFL